MKRYPAVIGATLVGLAGVLTFRSSATSGSLSASLGATARSSTGSSSTGSPSTGSSSTAKTSTPKTTAQGASGSPGTAGGSPTGAPVTTVPKPAASAASGPVSAVGAAAQYGYGVISVKVTVSGSKITDITIANLQTAESYSQQIANQVIPMLRSEILKAQSLKVYAISGATYTSDAYAQSVQSALTKLHFA